MSEPKTATEAAPHLAKPKARRRNPKAARDGRGHPLPKKRPARRREKKKAAAGRPTLYTKAIADEICGRVMTREPVRLICMLAHMPEEWTFYRWLAQHAEFCQDYARAKAVQMDAFAEELIEIADDSRNDWVERVNERTGEKTVVLQEDAIKRARLRIETRKWMMSKFAAKKYGDKLEVTHPDDVRKPMTLVEFEKRMAEADAVGADGGR